MPPEKLEKVRKQKREATKRYRASRSTEQRARIAAVTKKYDDARRAADPVGFKKQVMWYAARYRRPEDFLLEISDIEYRETCPYTGETLDWLSSWEGNGPTLDRICLEYGYIPGNVIVASRRGNALKSCLDAEDHRKLAQIDTDVLRGLVNKYGEHPGGYVEPARISNKKFKKEPFFERRRMLLFAARTRARKNGLPFNLSFEDLPFEPTCAVTGQPIAWSASTPYAPDSPSLDRIIPAYGYVPENVRVVRRQINLLMSAADPADRLRIAELVERTRACLHQKYDPRPLPAALILK